MPTPDSIPGKGLSKLSERRSHASGELCNPVHRELRSAKSVGVGTGTSADVRCHCAIKESGALANGRHCRMGAGYRCRLLEHHPRDAHFCADPARRLVGGIFQAILGHDGGAPAAAAALAPHNSRRRTSIVVVRLDSPWLWPPPIDSRRPPGPCTTVAPAAPTSCTFQSPPCDLHRHGPSRHQRRR